MIEEREDREDEEWSKNWRQQHLADQATTFENQHLPRLEKVETLLDKVRAKMRIDPLMDPDRPLPRGKKGARACETIGNVNQAVDGAKLVFDLPFVAHSKGTSLAPEVAAVVNAVLLDALDIAKGPIAVAKLPRRVPFGFHGSWIPSVS